MFSSESSPWSDDVDPLKPATLRHHPDRGREPAPRCGRIKSRDGTSGRAARVERRCGMSSGYFVLAFVVLAIVLVVLVVAYRKMPRD